MAGSGDSWFSWGLLCSGGVLAGALRFTVSVRHGIRRPVTLADACWAALSPRVVSVGGGRWCRSRKVMSFSTADISTQQLGRQQRKQASGCQSDQQSRRLGRKKVSEGGRAQAADGSDLKGAWHWRGNKLLPEKKWWRAEALFSLPRQQRDSRCRWFRCACGAGGSSRRLHQHRAGVGVRGLKWQVGRFKR